MVVPSSQALLRFPRDWGAGLDVPHCGGGDVTPSAVRRAWFVLNVFAAKQSVAVAAVCPSPLAARVWGSLAWWKPGWAAGKSCTGSQGEQCSPKPLPLLGREGRQSPPLLRLQL